MVLAKDQPLKIELPDQWLWDIIEEFIYQFQSFCNFRTKLAKRTDDDIEQLKRNIKIWNVHAVLNVMHSLVDKSRIVEQLEAAKKGGQIKKKGPKQYLILIYSSFIQSRW